VENNVASFKEVTTGAISGEHVEIASGLNQGEKLVVRGAFNLKDGDRIIVPGEPKR
jgi:multidrug efflux pump subunit AcrA (membrane-fusion protein)